VINLIIDINGDALRLLDDFIHYASIYPERIAGSIWYCEYTLKCGVHKLIKAFDEAVSDEYYRRYRGCGGCTVWQLFLLTSMSAPPQDNHLHNDIRLSPQLVKAISKEGQGLKSL